MRRGEAHNTSGSQHEVRTRGRNTAMQQGPTGLPLAVCSGAHGQPAHSWSLHGMPGRCASMESLCCEGPEAFACPPLQVGAHAGKVVQQLHHPLLAGACKVGRLRREQTVDIKWWANEAFCPRQDAAAPGATSSDGRVTKCSCAMSAPGECRPLLGAPTVFGVHRRPAGRWWT